MGNLLFTVIFVINMGYREMWISNLYFLTKYKTNEKKNIQRNHKALFIQLGGIGDFVLSLQAMSRIMSKYSACYLICKNVSYELAIDLNMWEYVIPIDIARYKKSIMYRQKMNQNFKSIQVDDLYNMVFSKTIYTELVVMQVQATRRYGFYGNTFLNNFQNTISNKLYFDKMPIDERVMELEKYTQYANWVLREKRPNEIYKIKRLSSVKVHETVDYYVVMPGGSYPEKRWESSKFGEVIDFLWRKYNLTAVLCGDISEHELGKIICKQVCDRGVVNYIGKTTLGEMIDIIADAKFLIGNDSAGVHLAVATGTRAYAIAGCWDLSRFLPYVNVENIDNYIPCVIRTSIDCADCAYYCGIGGDCGVIATKGHGKNYRCLSQISVKEVLKQIDREVSQDKKD